MEHNCALAREQKTALPRLPELGELHIILLEAFFSVEDNQEICDRVAEENAMQKAVAEALGTRESESSEFENRDNEEDGETD